MLPGVLTTALRVAKLSVIPKVRVHWSSNLGTPSLAALVATIIVLVGMGIRKSDLAAAPFAYRSDALLLLPLVQEIVTAGPVGAWVNPRLGYPGVQEWYDFPVADWLHFTALWALNQFVGHPIASFNLYFLLGYPLAAFTAAWAAGRLGVPPAGRFLTGVLFALQPYHQLRGEVHYFLSAYYIIPLTSLWAVRAAQGIGIGWFRTLLMAIATGWGGAYYAFFGCAAIAAGTLYAASTQGWRAGRHGAIAMLGVFVAGFAVHLPSIIYQATHGHNARAHSRNPADAEHFGLKLVNLALPHEQHNSDALTGLVWHYSAANRPARGENDCDSLGVLTAGGLAVALLAALFPTSRLVGLTIPGRLALVLVLLCTVGGVGAAVAEFLSPQVRVYARISIFLAFVGAATAGAALLALGSRWQWPAAIALAAFGVWDLTPREWFSRTSRDAISVSAREFQIDAAFYGHLEAIHPNAVVFSLPFAAWPEDRPEHVRPLFHTRTWRFGFGAIKFREVDEWQRRVSALPPKEFLARIVYRGFDALIYDERLLDVCHPAPHPDLLRAALGPTTILKHADDRQTYYDLRPFVAALKAELGEAEFARRATAEAEAISVLWQVGFVSHESPGREDRSRWMNRRGEVLFVNPTERVRRVQVKFRVQQYASKWLDLEIKGAVWTRSLPGLSEPTLVEASFDLPPGRHAVTWKARFGPWINGHRPAPPTGSPDQMVQLTEIAVTAQE